MLAAVKKAAADKEAGRPSSRSKMRKQLSVLTVPTSKTVRLMYGTSTLARSPAMTVEFLILL